MKEKRFGESQPEIKTPEKPILDATAIVLEALKKAGAEGIAGDQLLKILQRHGLVDVKVGEGFTSTKVSEWDETPEYEYGVEPIMEAQSIYDTDDVNDVIMELYDRKLARWDKEAKRYYLLEDKKD